MVESRNVPHVIVVPYPSQGHINPLLQFAKRLASKGVKATIATPSYTVKSINVKNVGVEPISDGLDHNGGVVQARKENVFLESFRQHGSRTLSRVIGKYENSSFPVSCVVYDSFLPWGLDVARKHGILGASFFTNNAAVCAIVGHIHQGTVDLPLKIEDKPLMLPGLPPLRSRDIPSFTKEPETNPAYLAMIINQFSNLDMADWIFCNTFQELEGEVRSGLNILPDFYGLKTCLIICLFYFLLPTIECIYLLMVSVLL